ncbi:MAG TPA: hypothetical protein VHC97_02330 [Thermoanaerobaculia bacterium]|nr:hypothetical protein [Thermoanaerobaculia bacterium]
MTPKLQLGIEYNLDAGEFGPLLTWFLVTEENRRPALFLGTSSDRIGSPEGTQSYYLTATKHHPTWPVSAYASLSYSEWDGGFNVPFGAQVELGRRLALQSMYDGQRSHLLLHYNRERYGVSLLWVWLEEAGISFNMRF